VKVLLILIILKKTIQVIFGSRIPDDRKRSTNEKNDKYDYVTETTTISNTQIITKLFYSCTLEDQCEEKFLLEIQPKLIKKDYTNLQKKLMDILTTSDTSSLTCNQWLKNEPVKCNGTCFGARKQLIDLKTHQPMKTYDSPTCEFSKVSPNVKIHVAKVPMSNGMFLTRNIYYYCSTIDCNRQEITERVEKVINENYKAFYEE
jgi:hypothetical protein